jgi:hypothetical protein
MPRFICGRIWVASHPLTHTHSLCCFSSLSFSLSHTLTRTHTLCLCSSLSISLSHIHIHSHAHTLSLLLFLTLSLSHTHAQTHTNTHTRRHTKLLVKYYCLILHPLSSSLILFLSLFLSVTHATSIGGNIKLKKCVEKCQTSDWIWIRFFNVPLVVNGLLTHGGSTFFQLLFWGMLRWVGRVHFSNKWKNIKEGKYLGNEINCLKKISPKRD